MTSGLEGVRGLVEEIAHQKPEKPDYWNSCSQCESNIDRAQAALAAEGVQAGEVSAYNLAVLDDAAETLDRIGEGSAGLREARARIASALSQQPEARGVVDEAMVERFIAATNTEGKWLPPEATEMVRTGLTAALTEARNVR